MTISIDLHAGHFINGGASVYLNETTENRAVLAECINLLSDYDCVVYDSTNNVKPQSKNLDNICKSINKHNADIAISLHLNFYDGLASGVECHNWDRRTKGLSDKITENISKELGIKNRGYKESNYQVLRETNPLAILIECCFVDSKIDYQKWNAKKCAKGIVNALVDFYSLKPDDSISYKPSNSQKKNYFKPFNSKSIVDGLKSIGVNPTMTYRKEIAKANGISNYTGTAKQNTQLCDLAKKGLLVKPKTKYFTAFTDTSSEYYPAFINTSIVDGLKSIGVNSSLNFRKKIAKANGIWSYTGRAGENIQLLDLAKAGKLKRV